MKNALDGAISKAIIEQIFDLKNQQIKINFLKIAILRLKTTKLW